MRSTFIDAVGSLDQERRRQEAADKSAGVHVGATDSAGSGSSLLTAAYAQCEAAQMEVVSAALAFEEATGYVVP